MVFRYFPTPRAEVHALVAQAQARGAKRFAVLHPDNAYGQALAATFQAEVAAAGGSVVRTEHYASGATSFGEQAEALSKSEFDALFIPDSAQSLALIAPGLAAAGLWSAPTLGVATSDGRRSITLLAPSVAFDPSLVKLAGRYLQGALFSVPFDASSASGDFVARFQAQFSSTPDAFAAFAYDAYKLVRGAVDAGAHTRETLAEQLDGTRAQGLVGPSKGFSSCVSPSVQRRSCNSTARAFVRFEPAARACGLEPAALDQRMSTVKSSTTTTNAATPITSLLSGVVLGHFDGAAAIEGCAVRGLGGRLRRLGRRDPCGLRCVRRGSWRQAFSERLWCRGRRRGSALAISVSDFFAHSAADPVRPYAASMASASLRVPS